MKKILIGLMIVLGSAIVANAQKLYKPHFHIGAKAGLSMSSVAFTPEVEQGMTSGMIGGITFRYAEERHVGLIAEINIIERGWKEEFEDGEPFEYSRKLTYIQLPLLTHIFFGKKRFKGFINLGPEISFMVKNSYTANFDPKNIDLIPNFPVENRMIEQLSMDVAKKFDYGITGGVGVEFLANRKNSVSLEARYYFGLGNIFPSSKKDVFDASRNTSIMLTLGYHYRIK